MAKLGLLRGPAGESFLPVTVERLLVKRLSLSPICSPWHGSGLRPGSHGDFSPADSVSVGIGVKMWKKDEGPVIVREG